MTGNKLILQLELVGMASTNCTASLPSPNLVQLCILTPLKVKVPHSLRQYKARLHVCHILPCARSRPKSERYEGFLHVFEIALPAIIICKPSLRLKYEGFWKVLLVVMDRICVNAHPSSCGDYVSINDQRLATVTIAYRKLAP